MSAVTETAPETIEATPSPRRRWLPWAIVVLAVGVAAFSTALWLGARGAENTRDDALVVAGEFIGALTTWDAGAGLDGTRSRIEELGTGDLLDEVELFFGGPDILQLIALQAKAEGTVDGLAVDVDGGTAIAFAEVQMRITDNSDAPPSTIRQQIRLELLDVDDVGWRVARFETAVYDEAVAVLGEGEAP